MLTYPSLDPIALSIGPLDIRWYGIAYVAGILGAWQLCTYLIRKGYSDIKAEYLSEFIPFATSGIIIGGRLGHVILYEWEYYLENPLEIIQIWKPGMAFHGGILGVIMVTVWFCRSRSISILKLFDLISVGAPIGLFFGRIANFINGELWGRVTDSDFGMIFPFAGPLPRHPSQLYEAFLEGICLFIIQMILIKKSQIKKWSPGVICGAFGIGYSVMRSLSEFFREPEDGFIGPLTAGQFWSLPLFICGLYLVWKGIHTKKTTSAS